MRLGIILLVASLVLACDDSGVVNPVDDLAGVDLVVDVSPPVDTMKPDNGAPDVSAADVGIPSTCDPGEGCFGELCATADDCLSGICTMHMGDKVCSKTCDSECPLGWDCTLVGSGGDGQYVCMSQFSHLCLPCDDAGTCSGETPNACVKYADGTRFCGGACDLETACPSGYACQEVEIANGAKSYQCVNTAGACPCSNLAVESSLSTTCEVTNDAGTCEGLRLCEEAGLSECSAAVPSAETCNGVDDDCNGLTDEVDCDDGNACTKDTCAGADGCTHELLDEGECLDGDACTIGDHCEAGTCVGKAIDCDDGNPCTVDSCDGLGGCTSVPQVAVCDDGDACTLGDICQDGVCTGSASLTCDDGNSCTDDSCGEAGCVFEANAVGCDDGNACTGEDTCAAGACKGVQLACDDGNLCTTDSCDIATGCVVKNNTQPCDDGDGCTLGDVCADGGCSAGKAATCEDGNPCTDDACDSELGCVFTANKSDCDDKNSCTTGDACAEGNCIGLGDLACDDGNPCTQDSCLADGGCTNTITAGPCDDGDACTIKDACVNGACTSGEWISCDDGNPCTDEACEGGDCVFTPNASECDDGNACTSASSCKSGACVATSSLDCDDKNACTSDACDPAAGCIHVNNALQCTDADPCTVGDGCVDGGCKPGAGKLTCDDGNPCTDDSCQKGEGCVFTPNASECDDGNACTTTSLCKAGGCVGIEALSCDDGNLCTDDACDPANGCVHTDNKAPCSDASVCTGADVCEAGKCQAGEPLVCDDGSACTKDSCDAEKGCIFEQTVFPCCDGGTQACGDACVDIKVDSKHCGGCDQVCLGGETCTDGECVSICEPGKTYCDGDCADLSSDLGHCGQCGEVCAAAANTNASCTDGQCQNICTEPFLDCNLTMADGCELNASNDLNNCGVCGKSCPDVANGTASCSSGACAAVCNAEYGDCDGSPANGCETNLTDVNNCGACGKSCGGGELCTEGNCTKPETSFGVLETKDVSYSGHNYLLLKVKFLSNTSKTANWCYEYQKLCNGYGYSPTGCGPAWNNSGGYATCKNTYGSVANDNTLSCNPSGPISQIANNAGYNDANGQNSFGFHSCHGGSCTKVMCGSTHCNSALSYIDSSKSYGYTVCIK